MNAEDNYEHDIEDNAQDGTTPTGRCVIIIIVINSSYSRPNTHLIARTSFNFVLASEYVSSFSPILFLI